MKSKTNTDLPLFGFKLNTPQLLKEVFDNYPGAGGVLKVPANLLRMNLAAVAQRCSELNDPVLNGLMCNMALYGCADPYDAENFDQTLTDKCLNDKSYVDWVKKLKL